MNETEARRPLMRTAEAAEYLGLASSTLEKWRMDGYGPRFLKIRKLVRYRPADLDAWIDSRPKQDRTR